MSFIMKRIYYTEDGTRVKLVSLNTESLNCVARTKKGTTIKTNLRDLTPW